MGFFSFITDKLESTIPPEQRNGAESAVAGIAGGAGAIAIASSATNAVTADVASLAQSVGANIPVMHMESNYLPTPGGGGPSKGMSIT